MSVHVKFNIGDKVRTAYCAGEITGINIRIRGTTQHVLYRVLERNVGSDWHEEATLSEDGMDAEMTGR